MEFEFSQEKFYKFRGETEETLNELNKLKENEIIDSIVIKDNRNLIFEYIFFTNYQKRIISYLNFDIDINNSDFLFKEFFKTKIYNNKTNFYDDLLNICLHMHLYLLINIENTIASIYKNTDYELMKDCNSKEINNSYMIIIQILNLILKLYKENIFQLKKIIIFFDSIIIFIIKEGIISDKYLKLKNIILFDLLFEKFYLQFLRIILIKNADNKDDISLLLNYLLKTLQDKQIKTEFNLSIITSRNILQKIINVLLNNINYSKDIEIYTKNKEQLIDCFADIYINNSNNNNYFESLINQNKESFLNLINYQLNKEYIFKDIYIQNFYLELLQKISAKEKYINDAKKEIIPTDNFFVFNGAKSEMSFYMNSFSLNNSILFFSFKLDNETNSLKDFIFPLIIFEIDEGKKISFEMFIKRENNINKLYIYPDKKNKKEILLKKIENILTDVIYYIAINFSKRQLNIYIKKNDSKNDYESEKISEMEVIQNSIDIIMKIGNNNNYESPKIFKGYIGPIIIIKNLLLNSQKYINNVINDILDLKNLYHFFPFFLNKETIYNYEDLFNFSLNEGEYEFKNKIKSLKESIKSFECIFYLTPKILNIYHKIFLKNGNELILPKIPNICLNQDNYIIKGLNISTKIKGNILTDFIRSNGLYYFGLVYEYIYQYFYLISENKNEICGFLNNDKIFDTFKESIKATLIILNNFTSFEFIINNEKIIRTLFKNLYEMLVYANKISNKIFSGIAPQFYKLFFTFKNKNNSKKNLSFSEFCNGLIDIIYSPSLYENYKGENYLNTLFKLHQGYIKLYINDKNPKKIFPFRIKTIFKIVNLSKVLDKSITPNNQSKNDDVIVSFFELLKSFLNAIDSQNQKEIIFKKLLKYIINYNNNNLYFSINFLNFLKEMIKNRLNLEKEEINLLLTYYSRLNKLENINIIEDININIATVLLNLTLFGDSYKKIVYICKILENTKNKEIMFITLISMFAVIFKEKLKSGQNNKGIEFLFENKDKNDIINYMNFFENIFTFIIRFLIIINKKHKNIEYIETKKSKQIIKIIVFKIFNLFIDLINKLKSELEKNERNINCIYCVINFLKFFHYIISQQRQIFNFSEKKFMEILLVVIQLNYNLNLINYYPNFDVKYNNYEDKMSVIEIILEIIINIFLNDDNNKEINKKFLEIFDIILFDRKFEKNINFSVFFVNDNLRYFMSKTMIKLDKYISKKCEDFKFYNSIFKRIDIFPGNFTTYFLFKIILYQKKFKEKKFNNAPINDINKLLEDLIIEILFEHKKFDRIDKKYFFRKISSDVYNEQLNFIKEKYINKKISVFEVEKYHEANSDNFKYLKITEQPRKKSETTTIGKNDDDETYVNECIKDLNKIQYFFDLDKNYIINYKKEIMNSIFSIYY